MFGKPTISGIKPLVDVAELPMGFKTAMDIDNDKDPKIAFQVPSIDQILGGGIRLAGITEISGEAGSGKSQLAMSLCLTTQFPLELGGIGKKALYISTEGALITERLLQMARNLIPKHKLNVTATQMLDNIIYINVLDADELLNIITARLERLLETEPIGLVVIDSVAAPFRVESNYIDRAYSMRTLTTTLQHLGRRNYFATVCINQVRHNLTDSEAAPALGLAWASLVTTRLQIKKAVNLEYEGKIVQKRTLRVKWAPNVPSNTLATFYICEEGIV